MEKLENIISLIERIEKKKIIKEGIDINYQDHTVSFNPYHENNVDTSVENNPTLNTEYGDGINVYSIFKRKYGTALDGNPLLYALKNEKEWKFATNNDKENIINQIKLIANKFNTIYNAGFTILLPSTNNLNKFISDIIKESNDKIIVVDNLFLKLTTEEILDIVTSKNSPFIQYYKEDTEERLKQLNGYLQKMNTDKNGFFVRHYVVDSEMRNVISKTIRLSDEYSAKYAKYIDGQDILLIDDSISRGQTIKEACNCINNTYCPKSITVLTLFSKLY